MKSLRTMLLKSMFFVVIDPEISVFVNFNVFWTVVSMICICGIDISNDENVHCLIVGEPVVIEIEEVKVVLCACSIWFILESEISEFVVESIWIVPLPSIVELIDVTFVIVFDEVVNLLGSIKNKYGVYASLGNHDAGETFDKMMDILSRGNVKVLMDESVVIDDRLAIIGRLDKTPIGGYGDGIVRGDFDDIIKDIDLPLVVLEHNPMYIDEYDNRVDLILSGHTHKGQLFPANIITDLMYEVDYGYYNNSGTHVVVSSGVGTWSMPMRVGSHCEIVSINIK